MGVAAGESGGKLNLEVLGLALAGGEIAVVL